MRLRKPCEHDRYDPHWVLVAQHVPAIQCPGGEFLPEGVEGDLIWANSVTYDRRIYLDDGTEMEAGRYLFVPLADQVGEPTRGRVR